MENQTLNFEETYSAEAQLEEIQNEKAKLAKT